MSALRLLLASALALTPVFAAAQVPKLSVSYTLDSLPNGLTFIVHEDPSVPIVTTNIWFHVGSGDEKPGRTGFAHLFEHLMFMGSQHAEYPQFDRLLEAAGANNNGSTTEDRTSYYENGPSSSLPLMLWLEANRMGWLLPTMDVPKVDLQRDVVKNERRQSYENQPYGVVGDHLPKLLFPSTHVALGFPGALETNGQIASQLVNLGIYGLSLTSVGDLAGRVNAVTSADVQRVARQYVPVDRVTLVVVGDLAKIRAGIEALHLGPLSVLDVSSAAR